MLFRIAGAATEPEVAFDSSIDDDGDFVVKANGVPILFINRDGKLHRFWVARMPQQRVALPIDETGHIVQVI